MVKLFQGCLLYTSTIEASTIEVAKGMGSTPWQILYKVKLPLALPVIVAGLRSMVAVSYTHLWPTISTVRIFTMPVMHSDSLYGLKFHSFPA